MRILRALQDWTYARPGRGEVFIPINVLMDEHNVFGPDISYLREERVPTADAKSPDFDLALELTRGESLTSPLLPGFTLALDAIFAPLRP